MKISLAALALLLPGAAFAQTSPADSLHAFLQRENADARANYADATYTAAFADLNGDGRAEALVWQHAGLFCGSGGCGLYIYTPQGDSWRQVAEVTIATTPVRLLATRTRGWRDLAVQARGGGMDLPREVRLRFDGRTYAAVPMRGRSAGRALITEATPSRPLFE